MAVAATKLTSWLPRRLLYIGVTLFVLVVDQRTKHLISSHLGLHDHITVLEGFFDIRYVRNDGAAFGILAGRDSFHKDLLFYATSTLAFVVLLYNTVKAPLSETWLQIGLSLVMGGAIGNLVDRVRYGSVIDFLDVHYRTFVWPTFNVADSCICVGIGIMAWQLLRASRPADVPSAMLPSGEVRG